MSSTHLQNVINNSVSGRSGKAGALTSLLFRMASASNSVSPWWSPQRDYDLENIVRENDYLSGTVYTFAAKMSAIPFRIIPEKIYSNKQQKEAAYYEYIIRDMANFGRGWVHFFSQFVTEVLTNDNGGFAEIIGGGPKDGALVGRRLGIAILDSHRCQRTGDPIYPVLYEDENGKLHKLHYTRVMFAAQMPSPRKEMFGVGYCAISRCLKIAQSLLAVVNYKLEKLGSRPQRGILLTKGGLDPEDVKSAIESSNVQMDNMGLENYSLMTIVGSSTLRDAGIDLIELTKLPDGFDEEKSVQLGIATIALAFGIDYRELFPAMVGGSSRADALLTHIKQRGKGAGQVLRLTENLFNTYFLPQYLRLEFDFQDDSQDRQRAEIRKIRADRRAIDTTSGSVDERTLREQMMLEGEITEEQFTLMEFESGRTADGRDILSLFYDPAYKQYLDLGVETPTASYHDAETMRWLIDDALSNVYAAIAKNKNNKKALASYYALKRLKSEFSGDLMQDSGSKPPLNQQNSIANANKPRRRSTEPTAHAPDMRVRNGGEMPINGYFSGARNRQDNLQPGRDDGDSTSI